MYLAYQSQIIRSSVKVRNITLSLLFVLFSSLVYAGGFQINEHGARAMAMGGAVTAIGTTLRPFTTITLLSQNCPD